MFAETKLSVDDQLALHLMVERANPNSYWKPFLNMIPQEYSQSIFFNTEEMHELEGSNLHLLTEKLKHQIKVDYNHIFPKLFLEFPEVFTSEGDFGIAQYKWALATIWSRAFDLTINGQKQRVLVPFADLFNHAV